jgi:hypothetical protein
MSAADRVRALRIDWLMAPMRSIPLAGRARRHGFALLNRNPENCMDFQAFALTWRC